MKVMILTYRRAQVSQKGAGFVLAPSNIRNRDTLLNLTPHNMGDQTR